MELPHLGTHCSNRDCNRLDFLPVKCDGCRRLFCSSHMTYSSHNCPTPKVVDNQVPVCPLCGEPVPCKRGNPPDVAVSEHIDRECQSPTVKAQKIYPYKCSLKNCKAKELLPFECANCQSNYCIRHRHPADHKCSGKPMKKKSERPQPAVNNGSFDVSKFQGSASEDEALARALAMSMEGSDSARTPSSIRHHDNCAVS